jgi:hypothetical protein
MRLILLMIYMRLSKYSLSMLLAPLQTASSCPPSGCKGRVYPYDTGQGKYAIIHYPK